MMKKLTSVVLLASEMWSGAAMAQSQSQIANEIGTLLAPNTRGAITASNIQQVLSDLNTGKSPVASPTFTGTASIPTLAITGSGSTGDVSGMSVIPNSAVISRSHASRATDNQIQATDYGVKCDGTTDDAAAIMVATNKAVSLGGRDVVFPSGTCRILTYIVPPSGTRWISRSGTTIYLDPAMTTGHPIGGVNNGIAFDGVSNILFDGITFQGAGSSTPSTSNCNSGSCARVIFQNTNNVVIRNSTFQNFGSSVAYIQGLQVFGGTSYLIDGSNFTNTSGDNLAFSNSSRNVEVRSSSFSSSTGDSALVCTIGGANFNFHDNTIYGTAGNGAPIVVMDRCNNWNVSGNRIYGYANSSGAQTGWGIRVARYADTTDTNHDFTIADNVISGTATAISVEASAAKQGANGTSPGGGRFGVTNNTAIGAGVCVNVSDSEVGAVTGNTCSANGSYGIQLVAYASGVNTGSVTLSGNTISGGSVGIRESSSGGTITPSTFGANTIAGTTTPISTVAGGVMPPYIPAGAPDPSMKPCQQGQLLGVDSSYLYVCAAYSTLGKIPLTTSPQ